jgi:3-methyl-2-oxobutanoate hydroxymethyltransferase
LSKARRFNGIRLARRRAVSYLIDVEIEMAYLQETSRSAITVPKLRTMREAGEKIAMLTCYDASFAALLDRAGVDVLLIGDSLGNVLQGHGTTLPVTLADIAYHTASVARGNQNALVVADMPFGTVGSREETYANAVSLMRAGAQMVKLEGGEWIADTVRFLVDRAIPVCGHVGLTPQSVHAFGGFKVQGKTEAGAEQMLRDAMAFQDAGAQLLVIEAVPTLVAREVTARLAIPTIGIGAGLDCSGQVLVLHDMLGIFPGKRPRFVKDFMQGQPSILAAVEAYVRAVKDAGFPGPEHTF